MNIAVTINDNYFYPLYIMLHTLFAVHPDSHIRVYLLHSRVGAENVKRLREICRNRQGEFVEIRIKEETFADAPACGHFTKEMYYRILAAKLLPETESRVLYLDPDMIILDSLESLYRTPMEEYFFAGCRDRFVGIHHQEYKDMLRMKKESCYFNSGFLLCNLEKLRSEQETGRIYEMLQEYGDRLQFPDQDLINALYEGKIKRLDDRYNLNPNILYASEYFIYNFMPWLKKPAVIHYMGKEKPWNPDYRGGLFQYYWKQEMNYTYKDKKEIAARIWKNPFYILRIGCGFGRSLWRKITGRKGKNGI